MREELVERILRSIIPKSRYLESPLGNSRLLSPRKPEEKRMHSGTTVLAFHYSEGVLFAADRKTSDGDLGIISIATIKVHQLADHAVIGCAGNVSDIQFVINILKEINEGFSGRFGYPLSILGQVNYLCNLLRDFRFYVLPWGLWVSALLGGYNANDTFEIYEVWMDGGQRKAEYLVTGSGTDHAYSILRASKSFIHQRKLSLMDAVDLAVKAIFRAGESDNGTSDLRIALPTVAVVTKEGFQEVDSDIIEKTANALIEKERHNG